jgi:prophage regulatory protein
VENIHNADRPVERLIRIDEVKRLTGLSTATIYRKIAAGEFPRPVPIGTLARAWALSEVQDWIAERIAMRAAMSDEIKINSALSPFGEDQSRPNSIGAQKPLAAREHETPERRRGRAQA